MTGASFDAEKEGLVAMLQSMGYRTVDVGFSQNRESVLIHASKAAVTDNDPEETP